MADLLDLGAPYWLTGLLLLPLIWWLHRGRPARPTVPVPALFLWKDSALDPDGGAYRAKRSSPMWLLRATVVALVILALSGPVLRAGGDKAIVVWFDDSLSMATSEEGKARSELALDALARALAGRRASIRSLGDHHLQFDFDASRPAANARRVAHWIAEERTPVAPEEASSGEHQWLVTDGSDAHLNALTAGRTFERVLTVGAQTENVGIVRLAVRRSLIDSARARAMVRVENAGTKRAARVLTIAATHGDLLSRELDLEPGATRELEFSVSSNAEVLNAQLEPGDALALDDRMQVSLDLLHPMRIHISGDCGEVLLRAVTSHPGIEIVSRKAAARLTLACGQGALLDGTPAPAVRWFGADSHETSDAWLEWSPSGDIFRYPVAAVRTPPDSLARNLLLHEIGSQIPLVSTRDGYVDVRLPTPPLHDAFAPVTLKLIGTIFDAAAGSDLLDPIAMRARDSAVIAGSPLSPAAPPQVPRGPETGVNYGLSLAAAAAALLATELAMMIFMRERTTGAPH